MARKIGIQMIDMYCNMVKEYFEPILSDLQSQESLLRSEIETQVKKEFGIYDLYMEQAELKLRLEEVKRQLVGWERTSSDLGYMNPIDHRVNAILEKSRNGIYKKVRDKMNELIRTVKLSGIDEDLREVFKDLPKIIASFEKEIKKLPKVDAKLIK